MSELPERGGIFEHKYWKIRKDRETKAMALARRFPLSSFTPLKFSEECCVYTTIDRDMLECSEFVNAVCSLGN